MDTTKRITVNRTNVFQGVGRTTPFKWVYDCVGPDGTRFDNGSIVTLRSVLRKRYGKDVEIVEPWKRPVLNVKIERGDYSDPAARYSEVVVEATSTAAALATYVRSEGLDPEATEDSIRWQACVRPGPEGDRDDVAFVQQAWDNRVEVELRAQVI